LDEHLPSGEDIIFYGSIFILLALNTLLVKNQATAKMGAEYLRRQTLFIHGAPNGGGSNTNFVCRTFVYLFCNARNNLVPIIVCQKINTSPNIVITELSILKKYSNGGFSTVDAKKICKISATKKESPPRIKSVDFL
jgi:hypothetical protein